MLIPSTTRWWADLSTRLTTTYHFKEDNTMTITEIRSFIRESSRKIRVDHIGDITDVIVDDRGTMAIVTHDLQLAQKMKNLGAEITEESSDTFGRVAIDELENRILLDCSKNHIHIEDGRESRTILLPVEESGSYGTPVCVATKKLAVFKAERIQGSLPLKPIAIKGSDYWALVWPVRIGSKSDWASEFRHIARQI